MLKARAIRVLVAPAALAATALAVACGGGGPPPAEVTPRTLTFTSTSTLKTVTILVRVAGEWQISNIELSGSGVGIYSRENKCDNAVLKVSDPKTPATCAENIRVNPFEAGKTATLTIKGQKVGGKKVELEERVSMTT